MCIRDREKFYLPEIFGASANLMYVAIYILGMILSDVPSYFCLLYTSDAADERSSVDLGGRRIIKKKHKGGLCECHVTLKIMTDSDRV